MAISTVTLQSLEQDILGTEFVYRGKPLRLNENDALVQSIMPATRVKFLINEAGREIQRRLREDRNVKHNFMPLGTDVLALPSDLFILDRIAIYDSSNDTKESGTQTGSASTTVLQDSAADFVTNCAVGDRVDNTTDGSYTTITTIDSATQITCSALTGGTDNTFAADDAYTIYDPDAVTTDNVTESVELEQVSSIYELTRDKVQDDEETGQPTKYMFYESKSSADAQGIFYVTMDVVTDARYFYDVYYWPTMGNWETDGDAPHISTMYQDIYYPLACAKIAQRLGDRQGFEFFLADYNRIFLDCQRAVMDRSSTPVSTKYVLMP